MNSSAFRRTIAKKNKECIFPFSIFTFIANSVRANDSQYPGIKNRSLFFYSVLDKSVFSGLSHPSC